MIKVAICSLGCAKNLVDSERMMAILKDRGYELTGCFEEADIIIVNTCGFIGPAKEESIDAIIQYAGYKKSSCRCLVVTGCLVKKYQQELEKEIPEVDLWLTSLNFETIGQRLTAFFPEMDCAGNCGLRRIQTTPAHWSYLKIAEGCDNRCAFCTIPQMRGPYVSRSMEDIVAEAEEMTERGVREIILLAQDTTVYGKDLYGEPKLKELLRRLVLLDVSRIRILYSYPNRIDRELLELISSEEKICTYLDIPMQHSEDSVLKRMARPERKEKLRNMLKTIRGIDSDYTVRSTFIVGFPGETEKDFEGLCSFLREAELDWVGVFPYSREEDTPAYDMPDQIPEETKNDRYDAVMALLSHCSAHRLTRWHGRVLPVLIDGLMDGESGFDSSPEYSFYGRTAFQAPEVDGVTFLKGEGDYCPGDMVEVKITGSDVYDLTGEIIRKI